MSIRPSRANGTPSWPLLLFLQWLAIVPAAWGCAHCLWQAVGGVTLRMKMAEDGLALPNDDVRTSRVDFLLAFMWSAASGYWCLSLSSGLLRRWLVYYDIGPAVLRLLSLHAIVFTSTHLTVIQVISVHEPIFAWAVCAFSAAISNTIQLWVTSNIRVKNKDQLASWVSTVPTLRANVMKRSMVMKTEKRRLSWEKVLRRTVIPLAIMSFVTMLVLMYELSAARWKMISNEREKQSSSTLVEAPIWRKRCEGVLGSALDPWIIPDVLSTQCSVFSETADWHHVYATAFLGDSGSLTQPDFASLESLWTHDPWAAIFVLSTTLPSSAFESYRLRGYRIWVVDVTPENLRQWGWYLGTATQSWLQAWDRWAQEVNFRSHLIEYLRWTWLFNVGGTWVDFGAIQVRRPPNHTQYLQYPPPASNTSLTRLRRGWSFVHTSAERAFSTSFLPTCLACSRIFTLPPTSQYLFDIAGLLNLPTHLAHSIPASGHEAMVTLGDVAWTSWQLLSPNPSDQASHHLASTARAKFALLASSDSPTGLQLVHPTTYTFRSRAAVKASNVPHEATLGSLDGTFEGANVIFVRGGPAKNLGAASVRISTKTGSLTFGQHWIRAGHDSSSHGLSATSWRTSSAAFEGSWTFSQATLGELNRLLATLRYVPAHSDSVPGRKVNHDEVSIRISIGNEEIQGRIAVIVLDT